MTERRAFVVSGEPKGKGRPRATVFGKHARVYTPQETAVYENHVAQCYLAKYANAEPYQGAVRLEIVAVFPFPKGAYWPNNAKHHGELREAWQSAKHVKKPDLDNVLKAILDGLNKANAWRDDCQVCMILMEKTYGAEPHVSVAMEGSL